MNRLYGRAFLATLKKKGIEKAARFPGLIDGTSDLLTDHRAHAPPDEAEIHRADDHRFLVDLPCPPPDRVEEAGLLDSIGDPVAVALGVAEFQRVARAHPPVGFLEGARVEQDLKVLLAPDPEVRAAFGAGEERLAQLGLMDDLAALFAFRPEPVGHLFLLGFRSDVLFGASEP